MVLATLRRKSRDNARTPMQWTSEDSAGFSTGKPWIPVNPNHVWLNAASQRDDPRSVYGFYRALIAIRHTEPILVGGDFALLAAEHDQVYAFRRQLDQVAIEVYANLSDTPAVVEDEDLGLADILLGNYPPGLRDGGRLAPWEVRAYRRTLAARG